MESPRVIWNHEVNQADRIARGLMEEIRVEFGWKALFFPFRLIDYIRFRRRLILTRKNLLFTKQLAFEAAKEIFGGKDPASKMGSIEKKTKDILDKEGKGFYTEKVRRKQLHEIELLIDHYLQLLNSSGTGYEEMIETTYRSKKKYTAFLNKLQQMEQEVIQAAITTMRKGSKNERIGWFRKVKETSKKARIEEAEKIFP